METFKLPPDFKEFLKLLGDHQVEYLLIGGYAVGYHGYPRATRDIDICIAIHPDNIDEVQVNVISLDDLKTNKRAAGRLKDLADLENLP